MLEDHLKITVAAEYGQVLSDVTAFLYFSFPVAVSSLKNSLPPPPPAPKLN